MHKENEIRNIPENICIWEKYFMNNKNEGNMKILFFSLALFAAGIVYIGCTETQADPYKPLYEAKVQQVDSLTIALNNINAKLDQLDSTITKFPEQKQAAIDSVDNYWNVQISNLQTGYNSNLRTIVNTVNSRIDAIIAKIK